MKNEFDNLFRLHNVSLIEGKEYNDELDEFIVDHSILVLSASMWNDMSPYQLINYVVLRSIIM